MDSMVITRGRGREGGGLVEVGEGGGGMGTSGIVSGIKSKKKDII